MRTITTREQLLVNGKVRERIATHIVTGAHGYETLCTSGYNLQYNKERVLIENCEKVADGELPVTCHTCFSIWQDVHRFKPGDFDTESGKGNFTDTELTKITIGGTVAKLAMRQPFVLFKGLTFQKLCLPGAFRPGDHHNKMLRPGLCVVHASPQYL